MGDKVYPCRFEGCRKAFPKYPTLVIHYQSGHKATTWPKREECEVDTLPEGWTLQVPQAPPHPAARPVRVKPAAATTVPAESGDDGKAEQKVEPPDGQGLLSVYREQPEPTAILKNILSSFPGMPADVVTEIMSWADLKGQMHPMEVQHLLTQMAGVPKGAAQIIPQKYMMALSKAAEQGSAEVNLALSTWGYAGGPQRQPGMFGFPQGGPPPGGGMFGWPQPGGDQSWRYPGQPETNPAIAALEARLQGLEGQITKTLDTFTAKLEAMEEKKKEDAIMDRISQVEQLVLQVQANLNSPPKTETPVENPLIQKMVDEVTALRAETQALRGQITEAQMDKLEAKITGLEAKLNDTKEAKIADLEKDLAEVRELAKKPPTGKNEFDVISEAVKEGMGALKEAGKDLRAVVTSGKVAQTFDPSRVGAQERARAGAALAATAERAAGVVAKEADFMKS